MSAQQLLCRGPKRIHDDFLALIAMSKNLSSWHVEQGALVFDPSWLRTPYIYIFIYHNMIERTYNHHLVPFKQLC